MIPERRLWRYRARGVMRTVNSVAGRRYPLIGLGPGDYATQASVPSQAVAELLKISLRPGTQTANLQSAVACAADRGGRRMLGRAGYQSPVWAGR